MKKEISAGGVVYKKEKDKIKVALIKDSYGCWALPKGHVEKGEKREEAAVREAEEELGLNNLKVEKFIDWTHFIFRLKGQLISKTLYSYLIKCPRCGKLKRSREVQIAKWVDIDKAIELAAYKDTKKTLKKAKEILKYV